MLVRDVPEGGQNLAQVALGIVEAIESPGMSATYWPIRVEAAGRYHRADVVDDEAADRSARKARQHDADQAAERCADPIDRLRARVGDQGVHVRAVLQDGVVRQDPAASRFVPGRPGPGRSPAVPAPQARSPDSRSRGPAASGRGRR